MKQVPNNNSPRNPHISTQPVSGQPLPSNWRQQAAQRAAEAEAAYLERQANAWRPATGSGSLVREARLSGDTPMGQGQVPHLRPDRHYYGSLSRRSEGQGQ